MNNINNNEYTLFIDESGIGNLNHKGEFFVLSCVLIKNEDIPIIQGYLRLLKREYFNDETKNIHCTDIFERTYTKYRKLQSPTDRRNSFITRIIETFKIIPFHTSIYYVNKDELRKDIGYKPYTAKKSSKYNFDLPYEIASRQTILDFVKFLEKKKSFGEIIIESRQFNDQLFVSYFDDARKKRLPGNITNSFAEKTILRINSLSIASKGYIHSGLELADIGAYTAYRKKSGDPFNRMKISLDFSNTIHNLYKKKSYIKGDSGRRFLKVTMKNLNLVKPSKLI